MAKFLDKTGREWQISLTDEAIREVLSELQIDLKSRRTYTKLGQPASAEVLVNTIYVLCREQANERGISDIEFGELLPGVIYQATSALIEARRERMPKSVRRKQSQTSKR